jgi:hypothetical protein
MPARAGVDWERPCRARDFVAEPGLGRQCGSEWAAVVRRRHPHGPPGNRPGSGSGSRSVAPPPNHTDRTETAAARLSVITIGTLKRAGVTLQLLWEEYARDNALAYKYIRIAG